MQLYLFVCVYVQKEKSLELERRNAGKALQKSQQEQKDNELKEWARNRAKEKEEERLAREKVKALIAQDRLVSVKCFSRLEKRQNAYHKSKKLLTNR